MLSILLLLLLGSIIIEGTVTTLPLVLACLLCLTIFTRDPIVFIFAFISGILLDVFALRTVGSASIFLLLFVFLILLYQRKYEIYSYQFVMVAAGIGSFLFLQIFGYENVLLQSGIVAFIAGLLFAGVRTFHREKEKASREKRMFI